jgi:hypothetical protein
MWRALALGLLCGACGGSIAGSCDLPNTTEKQLGYGYCITYTGNGYKPTTVKDGCSTAMGTYSADACAKGGSGSCTFNPGASTEYVDTYRPAPDGGFDFASVCASAGGAFHAM